MTEVSESLIFMASMIYLVGFAVGWKIGLLQKVTNSVITGVQ